MKTMLCKIVAGETEKINTVTATPTSKSTAPINSVIAADCVKPVEIKPISETAQANNKAVKILNILGQGATTTTSIITLALTVEAIKSTRPLIALGLAVGSAIIYGLNTLLKISQNKHKTDTNNQEPQKKFTLGKILKANLIFGSTLAAIYLFSSGATIYGSVASHILLNIARNLILGKQSKSSGINT